MRSIAPVLLATFCCAATISPQATAIDLLSTTGTGPVGNCQAALPAFEGLIRKRPLAIANEGATPVFVTCAFSTEEISLNVQSFRTQVTNLGSGSATVSCTAVIGDELGTPVFVTKDATLPAGGAAALIWTTADTPGLLLTDSIAISCQMPPLVTLNRNRITTLLSIL